MKNALSVVCLALLWAVPVFAANPVLLIERVEADLGRDAALTADERVKYLEEFRQQLGAHAFDVLKGERLRGAEVIMTVLTEGSFDELAVERTVGVASAAYVAIYRGAPAEAVEGIALYGFRKKLGPDKIAAWANGVNDLIRFKVGQKVAEDLVYNAAEHDWSIEVFNTMKWALVKGVREGHDPIAFARYLFGHYSKGGRGPGELMGKALRTFRRAADSGKRVKLPKYDSPILGPTYKPKPDVPKPDKPKPDLPKPDKPKPDKPKPDLPKPDKPKPDLPKPDKPKPDLPRPTGSYDQKIGRLVRTLESFLGTPYVWGGETRKGTDCSGLTQSSYAGIEVKIGRIVRQQWKDGFKVSKKSLKPGDLVFFITIGKRLSHVGMVTDPSKGEFIHASSSRGVVRSYLKSRYYAKRYAGARRIMRP